ncbi:MAG: hypothetical protein HFG20_01810 [Anaerotruncus sp.]|nr:hypothetical protein [Anaerotruncus sp.]
MDEQRRARLSAPSAGAVSLLTVFAVLCLTVFALLGLATVQADARLEDASVKAVESYYAADYAAQVLLAQLRAGEVPEGVSVSDGVYEYTCPIDEQRELQVQVRIQNHTFEVLRWQAAFVGVWLEEDGLELWDGSAF